MIKSFGDDAIIQSWLRSRSTIEFLGIWELLNNENFKPLEFEGFKNQAGSNRFSLSPRKWIETTNAIGLISKSGRYGGGTLLQLNKIAITQMRSLLQNTALGKLK